MKKLISLSLAFILLLSLTSCGFGGGVSKADYLGTWECDEFFETDTGRYLIEKYTFLESGAGYSQITLTEAWEEYEAGHEYSKGYFDWELNDDVIIVHTKTVGDIKFKFDEKDETYSTLLNITEGNRVYKKIS